MLKNQFKTLKFLSDNGFLQLKNQNFKHFDTLGLLARENLKIQINKFYKQNEKFSSFLVNNIEDVNKIIKLFNQTESLFNSFALIYKDKKLIKKATQNKFNYFNQEEYNLALFCDKSLSLNYFHWLQSQRHFFWRKLSVNPSSFLVKDLKEENNNQNLSIVFDKDDTNLEVETISYYKNLDFLNISSNETLIQDKIQNLDLIVCKTDLDIGTLSLLCDAYKKKENKSFVHLNELIAPYHFSILVINNERSLSEKTKTLISFIFDQSRKLDLNLYPIISFNQDKNFDFEMFDKLGVLYTILLEEKDNELIGLRNRNTELIEKFDVSQLSNYLTLYSNKELDKDNSEQKEKKDKKIIKK